MRRFLWFAVLLLALGASTASCLHAQAPDGVTDTDRDRVTLRKISLRFIPADVVLRRLGWERDGSTADEPHMPPDGFRFSRYPSSLPFPAGVESIAADKDGNNLLVLATRAGYATVSDIAQRLDYTPREVHIQVTFVMADPQELEASGISTSPIPASEAVSPRVFQTYLRGHPSVGTYGPVIATDIVPLTIYPGWFLDGLDVREASPLNPPVRMFARVNRDATVTLFLSGPQLSIARTVPEGAMAALPFGSIGKSGRKILIAFVTPTLPNPRSSP